MAKVSYDLESLQKVTFSVVDSDGNEVPYDEFEKSFGELLVEVATKEAPAEFHLCHTFAERHKQFDPMSMLGGVFLGAYMHSSGLDAKIIREDMDVEDLKAYRLQLEADYSAQSNKFLAEVEASKELIFVRIDSLIERLSEDGSTDLHQPGSNESS